MEILGSHYLIRQFVFRAMSGTYTKSELQERKILILRNLFEFSEMLLDYSREHYFEITEEEIKVSIGAQSCL